MHSRRCVPSYEVTPTGRLSCRHRAQAAGSRAVILIALFTVTLRGPEQRLFPGPDMWWVVGPVVPGSGSREGDTVKGKFVWRRMARLWSVLRCSVLHCRCDCETLINMYFSVCLGGVFTVACGILVPQPGMKPG